MEWGKRTIDGIPGLMIEGEYEWLSLIHIYLWLFIRYASAYRLRCTCYYWLKLHLTCVLIIYYSHHSFHLCQIQHTSVVYTHG